MSTSIDERVVEMRFDNKKFEDNVSTTMSTLEKLKQSLNLTGASKGLENIDSAAKKIDMSGLSNAVETIYSRFTALEVIGITALANIANSAVNAGKKIVSALTIEPVKTGFQEYETQINAVQTILANTQSGQAQINQKAVESIKETAAATVEIAKQTNEESLCNLKKTQKKALKSFKENQNDEVELLKDTQNEELSIYEEYVGKELEALEEKHRREYEVISEANNSELESFKKMHSEKMNLYEDEYMEKLKVVDEERYNAIKAIDDEIAAIEAKTEAENKEIELSKQNEKLAQLRSKVNIATSSEERMQAEKNLKEYQDELARKKVLEERAAQIDSLRNSKDAVNEEYDLISQQISNEYEKKYAGEIESFNTKMDHLLEEQSNKEELIKEQQAAEKEALNKQLEDEKKSINERQSVELEAIQERQSAELEAFQERQAAEVDALKKQNEIALDNIEIEKQAKLKALAATNNLSTKGSTLEDVNKALDELNTYADKTIYNFTEMTRNIGTFTAAGVDLDTSVSAIKGIANLAALSGSNSQQASTAMYQLSQALASGSVKLQDWNSVVNAGMGGKVFQDALKETARVHGIAIDQMIMDEGSFRETLQNGWLTSDILTETLAKFTGDLNEEQLRAIGYTEEQIKSIIKMGQTANDAATKVKTFTQLFDTLKEASQSGWTQSWEIIVGDFEEAKKLLTEISDVFSGIINSSAAARNEVLEGWKDLGGRTVLIEAVKNGFEGIISVITPVKDAFREIFPPITSQQLLNFTEGLRTLTSQFKLSEETSANLKNTFEGLFAVLDIVGQAFSAIASVIFPAFGALDDLGGSILNVTGAFGECIVGIDEYIRKTDIFSKAIQEVIEYVKTVVMAVKNFAEEIKDEFNLPDLDTIKESVKDFLNAIKEKIEFPGLELFHSLLERVHDRMSQIGEAASSMKSMTVTAIEAISTTLNNSSFFKMLEIMMNGVKTVATGIAKAISTLGRGLNDGLETVNFDGVFDIISGLSLGGIAVAINKFLKSITEPLEGLQGIVNGLTGILDGVRGCFEAYQTQLKAGTLMKIASAIGILAASILVISLIDSNKLNASLGAITLMFTDLIGAMAIFSKISVDTKGVHKSIAAMLGISTSVLILAGALKKIGELDTKQLVSGLIGIAALTEMMVATTMALSDGSGEVTKGVGRVVMFSVAIKILASACEDISKLNWEELAKGLIGIGVLLAEISAFLNTAKFSDKAVGTAMGIVVLSAAIKILASACGDFGAISWETIGKGLSSIALLLSEVVAFTKLTGDTKNMVSAGVALIAIGTAMKIFASAVSDISTMTWDELSRGLIGMAAALLAVVAAVKLMPNDTIGVGTGLIAVSTALILMAQALDKMGNMTWEEIGKGLITLGGSIAILAGGLSVMNGTAAGSAAMLVAAAALAVLTPVLSILGAMSWESIAKGLIAIAGAFAVIGVAGLVLTPLVPTILALGGAFTLIGVGILGLGAGLLMAGAGLSAIAIGISALAASGTAGAAAIAASLSVIVVGIAGLIPTILTRIGEGIIEICKVIIEGAPVIAEMVVQVALSVIGALDAVIPPLVKTIVNILSNVLSTIAKHAPDMIQSGIDILLAFLEGIRKNIGDIVTEFIDIIIKVNKAIADKIPDIIQSGIDIVIALINGLAKGIEDNAEDIRNAFLRLFGSIVESILVFLGIHSPSKLFEDIGINMLKGLIGGIGGMASDVYDGVKEIFSKTVSMVSAKTGDFLAAGKSVMKSLSEGISNKAGEVVNGVKKVAIDALASIKNKTAEFKEIGKNLIIGLKRGLTNGAEQIAKTTENIADNVVTTFKNLLGIHSPSKVFEEIGCYVDEGFAKGLAKYATGVFSTEKNVGDKVVNGMRKVMENVTDIINGDIDVQPTIRPVIDLSAATRGVDEINGMFSAKRSIELADVTNFGMNRYIADNRNGIVVNADNDGVVKAIGELRGDINALSNSMSRTQVVLDSGTLVGEIAPAMDKTLGVRKLYSKRGI